MKARPDLNGRGINPTGARAIAARVPARAHKE